MNEVAWPLFAAGRRSGAASLAAAAGRGAFRRLPSPVKSSETKPYSTDIALPLRKISAGAGDDSLSLLYEVAVFFL